MCVTMGWCHANDCACATPPQPWPQVPQVGQFPRMMKASQCKCPLPSLRFSTPGFAPKLRSFLRALTVDCKYKGINHLGNPQQTGLPPILWRDNSEVHSTLFLRVSVTLVPKPHCTVQLSDSAFFFFPLVFFPSLYYSPEYFIPTSWNCYKEKKRYKYNYQPPRSFTQILLLGKPN